MYKGDRGIEKLKKLYEGPLDRQFVIDDIPTKRNEKMTHLSSRLLAVALNGPDDYLKIAPYFYIENWRDFTDNPYSFELPGLSVSVLDYGAKGDAFTDDTRSIQAAIDDVSSRGGGRVVLPGDSGSLYERRYVATHLMMRSNVDLHIEKGAILWQSQDESDYSYAPAYGHDVVIPRVPWTHSLYVNLPLIQGKDIENVKITGQGKIRSLDTYSVDPRLDHYARVCTDRIHVIPIGFWKVRNIELSRRRDRPHQQLPHVVLLLREPVHRQREDARGEMRQRRRHRPEHRHARREGGPHLPRVERRRHRNDQQLRRSARRRLVVGRQRLGPLGAQRGGVPQLYQLGRRQGPSR